MYGGPLIRPDYLDDAQLMKAIRWRIREEVEAFGAFEVGFAMPPGYPEGTIGNILASNCAVIEKRVCPVLDLTPPLEEIIAGFKPAVRRAIARCQRSGMVISVNPPIDEVRQAYPIYQERMKNLGATVKPWDFVERVIRGGLAVALVAKYEGRPAGLVILLVADGVSVYWLSAIDPATSEFRTTNGLMDAAVRWLHAKNVAYFSLGESHGMGPGILRFKMGWGPEVRHSTLATYVYRPKMRRVWRFLEPISREVYALWRKGLGYA
jgi:hypothetical protein